MAKLLAWVERGGVYSAARVMIVGGRRSGTDAWASALGSLGLSVVSSLSPEQALAEPAGRAVDAVVLCDLGRAPDEIARVALALKERARPRLVVVAALGGELDPSRPPPGVDAALVPPAHPAQVAARSELLLRLAVMEDEARLRAATLARHGVHVDVGLDGPARPRVSVLYVGQPCPSFLGVAGALTGLGAAVSAAFSTFTAFDFLHEREFDAVIVNALDKPDTAYTVCMALRRNTRLFHTPVALLVRRDRLTAADEAFDRGASELLPVEAGPEDAARRVMSLARERQRRMLIKAAFAQAQAGDVVDPVSGLACPPFFLDHVDAMARRAHRIDRPLSMVLARALAPARASGVDRDEAFRQVGSMISRLVRAEDLAAELEPGAFAVAMPGAPRAAAEGAAQRIAAIAECSAYGGSSPFQIELRCESAQLAAGEGARALLARTIRAFGRGRAAPSRRSAGS